MTLVQVGGILLIFLLCPVIGGLPLIAWMTRLLTGISLDRVGTGNISVSAAFYHGGRWVGVLAVLSEAFKGIATVLLARSFFPNEPEWELVALIFLVLGRYWMARGAGTTNVVWGYIVHDPVAAGLVFLIGGAGFTLLRERQLGRLGVLVLLPLLKIALPGHSTEEVVAAIALSSLIAWIYQQIPDDLDLPTVQAQRDSQTMFKFFRGDNKAFSLQDALEAKQVGQKAATLSQLLRWGYAVPPGWVLLAGDDPLPLIEFLQPSPENPLVVRSSAVGEDGEESSAAGQYQSILNITHPEALLDAINSVFRSYDTPNAQAYRQARNLEDASLSVLIQQQVQGAFSGVAFSRDPITQQGDAVVIEALPGDASQVVSGQVTPEQYRVWIGEEEAQTDDQLPLEGSGETPPGLIQAVARLARQLEAQYHGVPQDVEWSYDGTTLWVLQSRPITTLQPIWTRKIAAEVIPGLIRPLTWSINRPLTCGVWGEIFTIVLGNRAEGLDFNQTATLQASRAYFNATLLGQLFRRMGLPPESLEFLTRGAKFSKPPLASTLQNVPGLGRLLQREWTLEKDFERDRRTLFLPIFQQLQTSPDSLSPPELGQRIEIILQVLKRATYYSILAPLSAALRQAIFKVPETDLDNSAMPEVSSVRSLSQIAQDARNLLSLKDLPPANAPDLFSILAENPEGMAILEQFDQWLNQYGYLSEVATDIAVPRWKEDPHTSRELLAQLLKDSPPFRQPSQSASWKQKQVQKRLDLKGKVTETYSRLLAELRWSFLALAKQWQSSGIIAEINDIFFLELAEVQALITRPSLIENYQPILQLRRQQYAKDGEITNVSRLVYGYPPRNLWLNTASPISPGKQFQGIAASPGQVEGTIKVLRKLQMLPDLDKETILVVPFTDSGWTALLSRVGGLIAEVGGRLSHGAIVAREYGIPAVMDLHNATEVFQDGQRVRLDGQLGRVEIIDRHPNP